MCTYLAKRGATYYFRRPVPAELRAAMGGRAEFMVSLHTKNREEAKRLIPARTIESQALLDAASATLPGAVRVSGASPWASQEAFEHWQDGNRDQQARDARHAARSPLRRRRRKYLEASSGDISQEDAAINDVIREALRDAEEAAERRFLPRLMAAAAAEDAVGSPPDSPVPAPQRIMLDPTIIDLWAAERKVQDKGKAAHAAVIRWFYERVGIKPVGEITRRDILAFKSALVAEGATAANIKVKLSRLRTLLQWAADNDYADSNAAAGVSIKDTDAAKNKRKEFDLGSLNAIFASPVYASGARPAAGKGEAAHWLPLLALYTGARLEELGQLRPGDIQQIAYPDSEGVSRTSWFVRIKEDQADNLKLKNANSERDVPVHPELEGLGFLTFVDAASKAKQARLFPKLTADIYGRLTAKWGEWFGSYLRTVCSVTDKRMVFHSFRHTFKQYARHANIIEGVQRQIMGHSSSDVADDYGSGHPLHQVVDGMGLYKVPGLVSLDRSPLETIDSA